MMRRFLVLLAAGAMTLHGAHASELTDRIRAEAQICANALLSGNYADLIARTHPRIVAEMGGAERAMDAIAEGIATMKADGISMTEVTIGTPSEPVAHGATVGLFVPQTIILQTPQGRFRKQGHMLAVSEDGGGTWSFIDTAQLDANSLKGYFPALADRLVLPPRQELVQIGK